MPLEPDDLLLAAAVTVRHLVDIIEPAPKVFPGLITSLSGQIAQFQQDGFSGSVPVSNTVATKPQRVLVQFNPSGSAFVLQTIT